MSKSNFSDIENAMRCEHPDQNPTTVDLEKAECVSGIESDDFKPDYELEPDVEFDPDIPRVADDEPVITCDMPED